MNKTPLLLCFFLLAIAFPFTSPCQDTLRFEKLPSTFWEEGIPEMVNLNEDSLPDMLILTTTAPFALKVYGNRGEAGFEQESELELAGRGTALEIVDVNRDNEPDIFVIEQFGPDSLAGHVFLGEDSLNFLDMTITLDFSQVNASLWHDFNEDGKPDLFISGISKTQGQARSVILLQEQDGFREEETNLLQEEISWICRIAESEPTFYIQTGADSTFSSGLYTYKENRFTYIPDAMPDYSQLTLAQGDLNHDGLWDLFASGTTKEGERISGIFFRQEQSYAFFPLALDGREVEQAEIADIDSDGLADLVVRLSENGESRLYITSEATQFALSPLSIEGEAFRLTDYNLDGQVEILGSQAGEIAIYVNTSAEINESPGFPQSFLSIPLKEGFLFSWSEGEDDKTNSSSLSYDLMLKGKGDSLNYRSSLIDEESGYDKHFGFGSLGTDLVYHLENSLADSFQVVLSTFDNAHFTGPNGKCTYTLDPGSIYSSNACLAKVEKDTLLCQPTEVRLNSFFGAEARYWVSYKQGYLGKGNLPYRLLESDTFYGLSMDQHCIDLLTVHVRIPEVETRVNRLEACAGDTLLIFAEIAADTYHWFNAAGDTLGQEQELLYVAQTSDTLFLHRDAATSLCPQVDTFYIEVSQLPGLKVSENKTIRAGEEAWLQAWGAENYEWFPKEYVRDPYAAVTSATPEKTTLYVVKGTSASGCIRYDSVQVTVLNDLFIPSLFSPNADGKNDRLEISGSGIEQLRFEVYDQSGTLVFKAGSLEEARRGWDGSFKGRALPAGNLVWHIQGKFADGSPLLFDSKSTGFLTLIR